MWDVEVTDQFRAWFGGLDPDDQDDIEKAVTVLEECGPSLRRPLVGEIRASRHKNMKELRPPVSGSEVRILFIFDPRRTAILLLGGDKAGAWKRWYTKAIPQADDLYDEYLSDLQKEGLI